METKILSTKEIKKAAELIKNGEVVAFPTETVYGLGANALNPEAVKKIFKAKGRPSDNPLIVHISNLNQLKKIAFVNKKAKNLIKNLWPGPLTIILKKKKIVPKEVTANLESVAVRMPKNKIALKLIELSGVPIAAPSANISGKPSGTCFEDVLEDFNGKISAIIKSKHCDFGIESSVVDLTEKNPVLLRPGALSFEKLKKFLPNLVLHKGKTIAAKSPGMKYKHYSPKAKIILFEGLAKNKIREYKRKLEKSEKKVKIIKPANSKEFSKKMFMLFRKCDKKNIDYILIPSIEEKGIGLAIMNRIRKASTKIIKK
ncbi:MAG: tRNA threonylcarbamoyladenosine biosynthesis protein [Candidatus Pacearchaeota archaeon]|nr:MAG: tRNA threonylcarbamoyladenosine biosynthesis protein [Candidatus Pacearchaeota archaeon]